MSNMRWVSVRGKQRPAIAWLKTLPTIPCTDAVDGWELKLESPQYRLRYWLGQYTTKDGFKDAVCMDYRTSQEQWVQSDYYGEEDYDAR